MMTEAIDHEKYQAKRDREKDWFHFAERVHDHIVDYAEKQYGNAEGDEQIDHFTIEDIRQNLLRYVNRMGRGARGHEEAIRDMLKVAHYAQFAYDKLQQKAYVTRDVQYEEGQGHD